MSDRTALQAQAEEQGRLLQICADMEQIVGKTDWPETEPASTSLAFDNHLQRLTGAIRARYLYSIAEITAQRWRTPPDGIAMPFPGNAQPYSYTYDRQHPPKPLEARMAVEGQHEVVLCSSGMAGINVVLQALSFLLNSSNKLAAFASYFETLSLLRIGPFSKRFVKAGSEAELCDLIAADNVGIVLVEPVHYNWSLSVTRWQDILTSLANSDDPPIVVLDTTLTGVCSAQTKLVEQLRQVVPVVICIRSGIKLDQQGLELANLGVVELWCEDPKAAEKISSTLKTCRSICGATLTWADACALAPEGIFSPTSVSSYGTRIFANARAMFNQLRNVGSLFASVSHPEPPWPAPLIVLELADGGSENYRDLATILDAEQTKRGLDWPMSGSFGFRSPRFETILPEELLRPGEMHAGALKIASGCYEGARHQAITELILELATFPDLQTAQREFGKSYHGGQK